MIDWVKLLEVRLESEEDAPAAIRQLLECLPDNMLLSILGKSYHRGHDLLIPYLEEEKRKRDL